MKKEISPLVGGVVVAIIVLVVAALLWKNTQNQFHMPDKPPSGPIELPPSQQGRRMPSNALSGQTPAGH